MSKFIVMCGGNRITIDRDFWYDNDMFEKNLQVHQNNGVNYACIRLGADDNYKRIMLHRFIMGAVDGEIIDHINKDTLDNRRENLRFCTHAENMRNSKKRKHSKQKYKGVEKMPSGRFRARIVLNKKHIHIGTYDTPEEAAFAYDKEATKLHKRFASINFMPKTEEEIK